MEQLAIIDFEKFAKSKNLDIFIKRPTTDEDIRGIDFIFHTNERDVLNALKNSLNFSTKFSYYNQAVSLSIRYILILTPLLFLFLYNRDKNMTS